VIKGILAYVLPKVVKLIAGLAVGVFVWMAFKRLFEKYFPLLQDSLTSFDPVVQNAVTDPNLYSSFMSVHWFDVINYVLPIVETFNVFAIFIPCVVTVYLVRGVFRLLDTWINGVTSLVSGGK